MIYSVDNADLPDTCDSPGLDKATILSNFIDVFKGIVLKPGKCHIHIEPKSVPVVHPPRRVPFAIRDALKKEHDRTEKEEVITKVTQPTKWVKSLVVFEKAPGKLRIHRILTKPF